MGPPSIIVIAGVVVARQCNVAIPPTPSAPILYKSLGSYLGIMVKVRTGTHEVWRPRVTPHQLFGVTLYSVQFLGVIVTLHKKQAVFPFLAVQYIK